MSAEIAGDSIDAAALARLHDYLRRAGPHATASDVIAARDAFMQGFRMGCTWGVRTTGKLSSPEFREAVTALADVVRGGSDDERETEVEAGKRWEHTTS